MTCYRAGMRVLALLFFSSAFAWADATYTGAASCARCHADIQKHWAGSRHSMMVQPATTLSVRGDFMVGNVTLHDEPYQLSFRKGAWYITESYLTGKPIEHRIDYTLGNRRIQHYLTTLPDGRIVVLPPSWDILRKQWFHNFDIGDPDESGVVEVQLWNKQCYSCHVSQEEKNFNPKTVEYKTKWLDFGVNCERCHGPGSDHITHYSAKTIAATQTKKHPDDIVLQTRLDPARNTMVCAQCHSFRDIFVPGFKAGDDYFDHFVPILEYDQPAGKDPGYWPDGRTRRFSTDAFGLWQSQCFLKGGVTCVKCHVDPHDTAIEKNALLKPTYSAICTQCHSDIGKSISAHTHHAEKSTGSSCVECHMPRTVLSIKAQIRDHSITVPVPENTTRFQIPNACNECHKDRDAAWAAKRMDAWWGSASRRRPIRRAETFTEARAGNQGSISKLLEIAKDMDESPLARANALGYLSSFRSDPRVFPAFEGALSDPHPLPRIVATLKLPVSPATKQNAIADLTRALQDPKATVRLAATVVLVGLGVKEVQGEAAKPFSDAVALYAKRAELDSDDAANQLAAGRFFLMTGDAPRAEQWLSNSLIMDPQVSAHYFLAYALAQQGKYAESRAILDKIEPLDRYYNDSQVLRKAIAGR